MLQLADECEYHRFAKSFSVPEKVDQFRFKFRHIEAAAVIFVHFYRLSGSRIVPNGPTYPDTESSGGGTPAFPVLAFAFCGRREIAVHPGAHFDVENARFFKAPCEIFKNDELVISAKKKQKKSK